MDSPAGFEVCSLAGLGCWLLVVGCRLSGHGKRETGHGTGHPHSGVIARSAATKQSSALVAQDWIASLRSLDAGLCALSVSDRQNVVRDDDLFRASRRSERSSSCSLCFSFVFSASGFFPPLASGQDCRVTGRAARALLQSAVDGQRVVSGRNRRLAMTPVCESFPVPRAPCPVPRARTTPTATSSPSGAGGIPRPGCRADCWRRLRPDAVRRSGARCRGQGRGGGKR
jgi:hypothetical protein